MSTYDPRDTNLGSYAPGATVGGITIDTSTWNNCYTISSSGSNITYSTAANSIPYTFTTGQSTVNIDTDGLTMKDGADIVIGGKSLTKAIKDIEERLCILHPNPDLEDRWEQLKSLRQQYIDLEKELLEKEKMWNILKNDQSL